MNTKEIPYEIRFLDDFIIPFLEKSEFINIKKDKFFDIVAEKNNKKYYFDLKIFRQYKKYYDIGFAKQQLNLISKKHVDGQFYLICLCNLSEKQREKYEGINILDLANLLYLCANDLKLKSILTNWVDYSFDSVQPYYKNIDKKDFLPIKDKDGVNYIQEIVNIGEDLIKQLENCKTGKGNDKQYERICEKCILYLFNDCLNIGIPQEITNDKFYRIDYVSKIKDGAVGFWGDIVRFYNTRYIVFEFKNYKKHIIQNNLYVTEKYLYSTALRNVAIIISRIGLGNRETQIAAGILKEHGKLILGISDEDLIEMIKKKQKGESPSEILQDKMDKFLLELTK